MNFLKTFFLFITLSFSFSAIAANQQNDYVETLLEKLTNLHGASGFETPVRQFLKSEWKPLIDNMQVDGLGNLLGAAIKNNDGPRVLLMAHMDEVGFIIRDISPEGYIYFDMLGDLLDVVIPGQRWVIMTSKGPIVGYSGVESVHISGDQPGGMTPKVPIKKMFIDIGVKSREEALNLGVRPGLPITPHSSFTKIGDGKRYLAKALDDRVGLVVVTEVVKALKDKKHNVNTVLVAATTQEEVGLRGASMVYESMKPDLVINIEVGGAKDFPFLITEQESEPKLGAGPTLFVYDFSMIPNQKLLDDLIAFSKSKGIPYQFEFAGNYMHDGSVLQKSGPGVPVINIGVPTRYVHSQSGVIDRRDLDATVRLITEFVQSLSSEKYKAIKSFD